MLHSAIDIVAISTGRETLLIGPSSAFGANARAGLIRDRIRLKHSLDMFMIRPGAADLLRPHLRRWGLHWAHSRLSEKETVKDALLRAVASGQLAIAVVPEVTLAFSRAHAAGNGPMASALLAQRTSGDMFPAAIEERLTLVIEMVPGYMTGATRQAFENALANAGIGVIAGGLMTWLGVHLVPGANVAVLAFDLFFLGSDVIRACETIGEAMQQVVEARSHADLEPAAKVIAGAIAMLIVAGVFTRLMKAKQVTRGPGKESGLQSVEKPGSGPKKPKVAREPQRPRQRHEDPDDVSSPDEASKARSQAKSEAEAKAGPKFSYDLTPGVDTGQPILFGQRGVSPSFSSKGRFKGASINDVVEKLKSGQLTPDDLPVEYIWVNGQKVVVNNRSLTTLTKAGMKPSKTIDMTGKLPNDGPDSLDSVLKRLDEMGGKPSTSSHIRAGDDWDSEIAETVTLPED